MKAKKQFGQNFLIDKNVIEKIRSNINASKDDLVIEIGPGMGALTKSLKTINAKVICYEIDMDMKQYLDKLEDNNTRIVYKDFLTANIKEEISGIKYNNLYVVGNLPYYITTPIIKRIIDSDIDPLEMIFMVQNEVADRFTANPGNKNYGSITLFLKYYFNLNKLFKVSKNAFNPVPKVESAVIKMQRRDNKPKVNKEHYFRLITNAFRMKRKTLKNNLNDYDFKKIKEVLISNNLNDNVRAEEVSEEVFILIENILNKE